MLISENHVSCLAGARDTDLTPFSAIISIEGNADNSSFRTDEIPQLILHFDDVREPIDDFVPPSDRDIYGALEFARDFTGTQILIHCKAGTSRSPALALAILAERHGTGQEAKAVMEMFRVAPWATPNMKIVEIADDLLKSEGRLMEALRSQLRD